jgi:hypothetical protein
MRKELILGCFAAGACLLIATAHKHEKDDRTPVFLNDAAMSFLAAPCVVYWKDRMGEKAPRLYLGDIAEARTLGYRPDLDCLQHGGFGKQDQSLSLWILTRLGIVPPSLFTIDQQQKPPIDLARLRRGPNSKT